MNQTKTGSLLSAALLALLILPGLAAGLAGIGLGISSSSAAILGAAASGALLLALAGLGGAFLYRTQARSRHNPSGTWAPRTSLRDLLRAVRAPGLPALRDLRYVAAIGQQRRTDEGLLTLLSVESYVDGFVLIVRLEFSLPPDPAVTRPRLLEPILALEVFDDAGHAYRVVDSRPSGGIHRGPRGAECRLHLSGVPQIDPAARSLRVFGRELVWVQTGIPGDEGFVYASSFPSEGLAFSVTLPSCPARASQ